MSIDAFDHALGRRWQRWQRFSSHSSIPASFFFFFPMNFWDSYLYSCINVYSLGHHPGIRDCTINLPLKCWELYITLALQSERGLYKSQWMCTMVPDSCSSQIKFTDSKLVIPNMCLGSHSEGEETVGSCYLLVFILSSGLTICAETLSGLSESPPLWCSTVSFVIILSLGFNLWVSGFSSALNSLALQRVSPWCYFQRVCVHWFNRDINGHWNTILNCLFCS